jgi:tRNA A-37 threonylcarbamoyl transferase component Bud32
MIDPSAQPLKFAPEDFEPALAVDRGDVSQNVQGAVPSIFKSERNTLVWRQRLSEHDTAAVFKLYRHINVFKLLRSKLGPGRRVIREFAALARMTAAGVPCSEPLGIVCGRTRESGICEALVTRLVEGSVTLEEMAAGGRGFAHIDLAPLFRHLRRMHKAGVYHGALSPRNIMVTQDVDNPPAFHLIDMERSILFPCDITDMRMARRDLISLCMYISRYEGTPRVSSLIAAYGIPESERDNFMRDLGGFRSSSRERDLSALEFMIRAFVLSHRCLRIPGMLWANLRDNQGRALDVYYPIAQPEWQQLALRYWNDGLDNMEQMKRHAWGGVTHGCDVPGVGKFYFKRFAIRSLRFIHKPPRARNTVNHQAAVTAAGFHVPEIRCLIERRRAGVMVESAVIAAELKDQHSLNAILNLGQGDVVRSWQEKRDLLKTLGREVGCRHAAGFFHGDLHLGNVFCRRDGETVALNWIDNEEGSQKRRLPMRLRLHDLDHINRFKHQLSLTDRMVMWKAYVDSAQLPEHLQREVMRRVIRKSQRFWRKKGWMS